MPHALLDEDGVGDRQTRSSLRTAGVELDGTDAGATVLLVVQDAGRASSRLAGRSGGRTVILLPAGTRITPAATWRLLSDGASDVVEMTDGWAEHTAARLTRWETIDEVVDGPLVGSHLIGRSATWLAVLRRVVELALYSSSPLLLSGESGTGKELLARLIHALDRRATKAKLVVLDCTTVVESLSGSEFFGHERGAFTGSVSARDGAFAMAHEGTLFLDEVGELPPSLQAEVLRAIQEGTYKRVGGDVWKRTSFRLVTATNRDLLDEQRSGTFRRDLYHRIAGNVVSLPPLRDRRADIVPLFRHFLTELSPGTADPALHPSVVELLMTRDYAGNVRELRQLAARIHTRRVSLAAVGVGDVAEQDWPAFERPDSSVLVDGVGRCLAAGQSYAQIRDAAADAALRLALDAAGGNVQLAAGRLGVTDRTVQKYLAQQRAATPPTVIDLTDAAVYPTA